MALNKKGMILGIGLALCLSFLPQTAAAKEDTSPTENWVISLPVDKTESKEDAQATATSDTSPLKNEAAKKSAESALSTVKSKPILLENKVQEKDTEEKAEKKENSSVTDEKIEENAEKGSEKKPLMSLSRTGAGKETDRGVQLSMTEERSYRAVVSFENMTLEELKQANFSWTLSRTKAEAPNDWSLFPHQKLGGPLQDWRTVHTKHEQIKEEYPSKPLFKDIQTKVQMVDGKPSVVLTFRNNKLFGFDGIDIRDRAVVRSAMMDYYGTYHLTLLVNGKAVAAHPFTFRPYDVYRSQKEVDQELPEAVAEARKNGLYADVKQFGSSAQGRAMRTVFVAKSEKDLSDYQALKARVQKDPAGVLKELRDGTLRYKVPVMYSNIHADEIVGADAVMEFLRMLSRNEKVAYRSITGLTEEGKKELAVEMEKDKAVWSKLIEDKVTGIGYIRGNGGISNGSNYDGGIDASADLSEEDFHKYYNSETRVFDPRHILDHVFFILVPSENVDARTVNSRTNGNGFDLNRDNTYQTQPETRAMAQLISKWNPISLHEFHGYYQYYQIEPCSPTHDPNNEYDLFIDTAMKQGEAFAAASLANNRTMNSAKIPLRDYLKKQDDGTVFWEYPFDDMSSSYTPQYAMMHGVNAYTVESAYANADAVRALQFGCVGNADFVVKNRDRMFTNQVMRYLRGVKNIDAEAIRKYYVNQKDEAGAEADVFRPNKNENKNFFPEYYVIPMDAKMQRNRKAAEETIALLLRNDVVVSRLTKAKTVDGVVYPQGSIVINMRQAKRNMANQVLYPNMVIRDWSVGSLYSEPVTNFSAFRGFTMNTLRKVGVFDGALEAITEAPHPTSVVIGKGPVSIIKNNSLEAIQAVNALLKQKAQVSLITAGPMRGNFATPSKNLVGIADRFVLNVLQQGTVPEGRLIQTNLSLYVPRAYAQEAIQDKDGNPVGMVGYKNRLNTNGNWDFFALQKQMGFTLAKSPEEASAIVGSQYPHNDADVAKAIANGKPYVGYTSDALQFVKDTKLSNLQFKLDGDWMGFDALSKVEFPVKDLATAPYEESGDHIMYGFGGDYFLTTPDGGTVLIRTAKNQDPLEAYMTQEYMNGYKGSIQAVRIHKNGKTMRLFANTLTNKAHQQDDYRYLANSIYAEHLLDKNWTLAETGMTSAVKTGKTNAVKKPQTQKEKTAPKTSDVGIESMFALALLSSGLFLMVSMDKKQKHVRTNK